MSKIATEIDGYLVELEIYPEGYEPQTDCFISYPVKKPQYSASLAAACSTGYLTDTSFDRERTISDRTLQRIETWALENGY